MPKFQKAPLFSVFALSAISKNHGASVGQKAPFLREIARSGHIGDRLTLDCVKKLGVDLRFALFDF